MVVSRRARARGARGAARLQLVRRSSAVHSVAKLISVKRTKLKLLRHYRMRTSISPTLTRDSCLGIRCEDA